MKKNKRCLTNVDNKGVIGRNIEANAAKYQAIYDSATPEERSAFDNIANDYGYSELADVPGAGAFGPSQFINNLLVKTTQQLVLKTKFKFNLTEIQNIETITNGAFWAEYGDIFQGSSELNNDVYNTARTGEGTTPRSAYSDVIIDDFNSKITPVYEEVYHTDTEFSRKLKVLSNILNDWALSQAVFMSLVKEISEYLGSSIDIFNLQRTAQFLSKTENYNKVFTYKSGSFAVPTDEASASKTLVELQGLYNDIRSYIKQIRTPSRKWLGDNDGTGTASIPTGSTTPLIYDGKNSEIKIIMDAKFESLISTFFKSGTYQLSEISWPSNVSFLYVDMEVCKEWYSKFDDATDGFGKIFGSGTNGDSLPIYIGIDGNAYKEFRFYEASKTTDTPKTFSTINYYEQRGQMRMKNCIMFAGGYALQTPSPAPRPTLAVKPRKNIVK